MAARIDSLLDKATRDAILNSKLLVVGAGGIGCELLKNLVLTGFEDIHVIDLDTIDVSNLNRQFLFQKVHVGQSKAVVAKESAEKLNPCSKITAYHDSITNLKYNVDFYRQFSAVANALDNMAARKHVNRMCLAADIPLIESGSAGYLGQVTVYKKKQTECYECVPRPAPKDFPTCTIRNTPSESIHCVVWAKHLFNQLFGEDDPHQDVSPETSDQQQSDANSEPAGSGDSKRISTKEWARNCQYDAQALFNKLFHDDIKYLLQMKHLWEKRPRPVPLVWSELPDAVPGSSLQETPSMKDQEVWSIRECAAVFTDSLAALRKKVCEGKEDVLIWDKDDKHCMDFVAACANMRSYCFGIPQKSRFNIKSMAGNIIPAIATTNAIIGGLIVLQLLKVLKGQLDQCRTVILNKSATSARNKLLAPCEPSKPNPNCFVCSPKNPEVHVRVNTGTLTVKTLEEKILIEALNMIAPDVFFDDGKGTILISSDPDEDMEGIKAKTLKELDIQSGSHLQCDDFFQQFTISLSICSCTKLTDQDFEIISDVSQLKPTAVKESPNPADSAELNNQENDELIPEEMEGGVIMVDDGLPCNKRRFSEDENGDVVPTKKSKVESDSDNIDIVIV